MIAPLTSYGEFLTVYLESLRGLLSVPILGVPSAMAIVYAQRLGLLADRYPQWTERADQEIELKMHDKEK